jgi:hypothetical protein
MGTRRKRLRGELLLHDEENNEYDHKQHRSTTTTTSTSSIRLFRLGLLLRLRLLATVTGTAFLRDRFEAAESTVVAVRGAEEGWVVKGGVVGGAGLEGKQAEEEEERRDGGERQICG